LEDSNPIRRYFLRKEFAISIPAMLLVAAVCIVGIFVGVTLSKFGSNKKQK
jgi:xanthosine utilization system XapX-like protein